MKKENYSKIFMILCALNITCLLMSNIITIKTINIVGLVFTAGDMHTGQSLVVKAIRQGRDCARAVGYYLMGYTNL